VRGIGLSDTEELHRRNTTREAVRIGIVASHHRDEDQKAKKGQAWATGEVQ
jgi:hypothetical protein